MLDNTTDFCQLEECDETFDDESHAVAHYEAEHNGVVFVDTREKDDEILSEVARVCSEREVGFYPKKLDSGDYVYHGDEHSVAIEYKGITDAVNSALDDRLYEQANRMAKDYDRAFVFIVGKTSEVKLRGRQIGYGQAYGQIMGVIPQILAKMNMPVQWLRTEEQFADIAVRTLIDSGNKGLEDNEVVLVSPGISSDSQKAVIKSFDGIGSSAAKSILQEFGSVDAVSEASYEELKEVSGIGSTTARKIWNTFNLDWDEDGFDAKTKDHPMWVFFGASGISSSILYETWEETDGLTADPEKYIEEVWEDELGPHRLGVLKGAVEDALAEREE